MFIDKGFIKLGPNTYRNPKTQRQYYIDNANGGEGRWCGKKKGMEYPHVDIHHFRFDSNVAPIIRNGIKLPDMSQGGKVKIPMGNTEKVCEEK
jgi:hypothetical protein